MLLFTYRYIIISILRQARDQRTKKQSPAQNYSPSKGHLLAPSYDTYPPEMYVFIKSSSSYLQPPNLCPEAVDDYVGKPWIFIQYLCLIALLCDYVL